MLGVVSGLMIAIGVVLMIAREGTATKRHPFFHDIYFQKVEIPPWVNVTVVPPILQFEDHLFQDFPRHYKVGVTKRMGDHLLVDKNAGFEVPPGYVRINREPTMKYHLYRRETAP